MSNKFRNKNGFFISQKSTNYKTFTMQLMMLELKKKNFMLPRVKKIS